MLSTVFNSPEYLGLRGSLFLSALDKEMLRRHILSVEDQEFCRAALDRLGLVAFVGNGSVLPRKSGVDDRPMTTKDDPNLVIFKSPPELEVTIDGLPNSKSVTGMGIKRGVPLAACTAGVCRAGERLSAKDEHSDLVKDYSFLNVFMFIIVLSCVFVANDW